MDLSYTEAYTSASEANRSLEGGGGEGGAGPFLFRTSYSFLQALEVRDKNKQAGHGAP